MATSDIDALRAELEALRHEFDELRLHLPDAYVEGDLATDRVTFMNRVACQVFGCTPEQATGLHARDLFDDGEYERARGQLAAMLER
ncbi:MAG: PAS domain-containing protein, partial [Burkholderiales bacterium]